MLASCSLRRVLATLSLVLALAPWRGYAVEPQELKRPLASATSARPSVTASSPSSPQSADLHVLGGLWKDDRIFVAFTAPISAADVATMTINGAVVPWVIVSDGRGALSTSTFRQGPYLVAWGNEQVQLVDHKVAAPQVLLYEAPNPREVPESPTGQTQSFQGHRVDPETGFVYLRNRYYDPEMGMFITADPMGFPDGPSPYAFGAGDPINGRDPFGLQEGAEIRQRQYEAYRSGIDPMYMRGAADQIDLILADPRFEGTMQMLGGCSEAAVGALAAGGTAGLAAVPGGIAMLHGSDLCGAGWRTLTTGRYQEPLTVQGMQAALLRAGLPPERAYLGAQIFDAALGGGASAYSMRPLMIPPARPFPQVPRGARYVYDIGVGQYRDLTTGRFIAQRNLPYPTNRGFVSSARGVVGEGEIIGRYGPAYGRYAGPPGASVSELGLPVGSEGLPYTRYRALRPIEAEIGPAAAVPEFGASGGATQYLFDLPVEELVRRGYLEALP